MRSTIFTEAVALTLVTAVSAGAAWGNGSLSAEATAEALSASLPRELLPGIMVLEAGAESGDVVLRLAVAADLPLPSAEGLALLLCVDLPVADFVAAGGAVLLTATGRTLAAVTRCPEAP